MGGWCGVDVPDVLYHSTLLQAMCRMCYITPPYCRPCAGCAISLHTLLQAMCRMCEMLHADLPAKVYQNLGDWWENHTCKEVVSLAQLTFLMMYFLNYLIWWLPSHS